MDDESINQHSNQLPTICTVSPTNHQVTDSDRMKLLEQTRNGVYDWTEKLQDGQPNKNLWNINYNIISSEYQSHDEDCNIIILFESKPLNTVYHHKLAGYHYYDRIQEKHLITIYYLKSEICPSTDGKQIFYNLCYKNNLKTENQLRAVIQHEIGHALGLEHFSTYYEKSTKQEWMNDISSAPSIMVDVLHDNASNMEITQTDVNNIRSIYGTNGFR